MLDGLKQLGLRLSPGLAIRFFARPYVAGWTMDSALGLARELWSGRRLLSTIDLLGEEAREEADAERARATYEALADRLAADPAWADPAARPTLSLKLSALVATRASDNGVACDRAALAERLERVATHARERGVSLTIDMEDHRWTSLTLEAHAELRRRGHDHVGTVLQSRLFRTARDVEELPEGSRIRMVIGVYREPAAIAHTDKRVMKDKLLEQCARLFERGATVEIATHDVAVLERFFREIVLPRAIPPERYEVQMLLGVPREAEQRAMVEGRFAGSDRPARVRLYVPYAESAQDGTAYCRRRLIENPDLVSYGLVNLFKRI